MKFKDFLINIIHKYKSKCENNNIDIRYILKEDSFIAFFKLNEIIIEIFNDIDEFNKAFYAENESPENQNSILNMRIGGISKDVKLSGEGKQKGKFSYYTSLISENKIVDIPVYERIKYKSAFRNIDILFSTEDGKLQSDFMISDKPGRSEVALIFEGAGNIVSYKDFFGIYMNNDVVRFKKPGFYQEIEGMKILLKSEASILDNRIVFKFNYYDRNKMLIV